MKVYVVQELDMNGEPGSIVGICSSKEKAQLAIEALEHYEHENYQLIEIEMDGVLTDVRRYVDDELEAYESCMSFLERMKQFEEEP